MIFHAKQQQQQEIIAGLQTFINTYESIARVNTIKFRVGTTYYATNNDNKYKDR